jgi:VanZ family protein
MATFPALSNPSYAAPRRSVRAAWIAALCAVAFVAFTSTNLMGGSHTQIVVNGVWRVLFGKVNEQICGPINFFGRKVGHFFGYGTIGLIFRKAWYASLRSYAILFGKKLLIVSAALGVTSTFVLASLDEWHQHFLATRHGSFRDVLMDTAGAVFLTLVLWAVRADRRRRALQTS